MAEFTQIGTVIKPHGLKGAVSIHVDALYMHTLEEADMVFIDHNASFVPYQLKSISLLTKDRFKVELEGVQSQAEAEELRGKDVYLPQEDVPEHTKVDLVGFEVHIAGHGYLGKISQVLEQSVQALIEVEEDDQTWLIPFVDSFILRVDIDQGRMDLELPEGLLEI
jgi:16S rRNA processing protein RimM